jgi:hypothetical protein
MENHCENLKSYMKRNVRNGLQISNEAQRREMINANRLKK